MSRSLGKVLLILYQGGHFTCKWLQPYTVTHLISFDEAAKRSLHLIQRSFIFCKLTIKLLTFSFLIKLLSLGFPWVFFFISLCVFSLLSDFKLHGILSVWKIASSPQTQVQTDIWEVFHLTPNTIHFATRYTTSHLHRR